MGWTSGLTVRTNRLRGLAIASALGLGVTYLVITRLVLAWNGIIGADGARDLAIASRLLRGEEFPLRGPLFGPHLYLGPLYYFVVAGPLAVFGSATAVITFLALLSLLGVYFGYRVGALLFDRRTGFLCACLLAGDFIVALGAFQISNADLILPVSLALLYTILLAISHRRPTYLGIALPLTAVAVQIHPATVGLLPLLAIALWVPTEGRKARALAIGAIAALILLAPYLVYELRNPGANVRQISTILNHLSRVAAGPPLSDLPKILWWAMFAGPRAATQLSRGIAPAWIRHLALVVLYGVSIATLIGLGLTIAGLFQRERRRPCVVLLCWFLPWWLIVPRILLPVTWWYLYPIQGALLLFAAQGLAWVSDRIPLTWRWRRISPYAFAALAFVLPAWLAMAAFQRSAKEGLLHLPGSLFWHQESHRVDVGDFVYLNIGIREEERLTKALLQESECSASLLTRLHGLPLWLALQSRGILFHLHQPRCRSKTDQGHTLAFVGVRHSDLPPSFRRSVEGLLEPFLITRQPAPGPLTEVRYSDAPSTGWEAPGFDDGAWRSLSLPAFRPPDAAVYPPPPDMAWDRSPIFIRARLRHAGPGSVVLGVAFPSAAPWLYQGRVEAVLVNGKPAPPPRVHAAYLLLYDLSRVLTPGENVLALAIGGAPHFTLDLFALMAED